MDPLIRRGAEDIYLGLKDIGRGGKFDQIILTEIPLGEFFLGLWRGSSHDDKSFDRLR